VRHQLQAIRPPVMQQSDGVRLWPVAMTRCCPCRSCARDPVIRGHVPGGVSIRGLENPACLGGCAAGRGLPDIHGDRSRPVCRSRAGRSARPYAPQAHRRTCAGRDRKMSQHAARVAFGWPASPCRFSGACVPFLRGWCTALRRCCVLHGAGGLFG
jgi:hypothetical protein